jgi:hypothetical protein
MDNSAPQGYDISNLMQRITALEQRLDALESTHTKPINNEKTDSKPPECQHEWSTKTTGMGYQVCLNFGCNEQRFVGKPFPAKIVNVSGHTHSEGLTPFKASPASLAEKYAEQCCDHLKHYANDPCGRCKELAAQAEAHYRERFEQIVNEFNPKGQVTVITITNVIRDELFGK